MRELDVLFLGGLFPQEIEEEVISHSVGFVENAANNLQWEIVKGLDKNLAYPPKILNSIFIGSFPRRYKKMKINSFEFTHFSESFKDMNVGFLNLPILKNTSRYQALKPHVKGWVDSGEERKKVIIAYSVNATFTKLLRYAKELNDEVKTCLIVPDLPQYMNLTGKTKFLHEIYKSIQHKEIDRNLKFIDSYVLLTEQMKEALNIIVPYVIVEGIATDLPQEEENEKENPKIKSILYTGSLYEKYGVLDLLNAFREMEGDHLRLVICGEGEAESTIQKASEEDERILYKGLLKRMEVLQLQKSATLLVNPRTNKGHYTKFSFPSKIMEYMSSGTPVLAYMLDGIPQEYAEYIYVIDEEEGILSKLKEVLAKEDEELKNKGVAAKKFVSEHKNNEVQVRKMVSMFNSL